MRTILLTNHYPSGPYEIVKNELPEGFNLIMLDENSQECLEQMVGQADYILASGRIKISRRVIEKADRLKMIQRTGVGLDSLDLDEIKSRNIPLYVNHGVNAQSVAEHTLLLILACLRKLTLIHKNTVEGVWKKQAQGVQTYELKGKTVGLVGMGNIARIVVRLLSGFGTKIIYYDIYKLSVEEERELGISYCDLETLLRVSDIVSLHCPLTDQTRGFMNKDAFATMKNETILVNTSRGGLVDMKALLDALESGKLAFAGLDVFDMEPLTKGHSITKMKNVILTPHIGGITRDSFQKMMQDAMRNIEAYEKGNFEEIKQYLYI